MILKIILDSSMVEHSAVNRVVAGSSPARGVEYLMNLSRLSEELGRKCEARNKAPWSSG